MVMSDSNSNGPQFSKIITILCIGVTLLFLITIPVLSIIFNLTEPICVALITAAEVFGSTAVVWNLKKSQAENTIKIYLSAYKEIIELKQDSNLIDNVEEHLIDNIDKCIEENLTDATNLIEKQEIL